jgi:tripartite-type tricarboxylate transporter receptor subunit TctC
LVAGGVKLLQVPCTAGGPAVIGRPGGNTDALASGSSPVIQQLKAGKLRVLTCGGDKRLASHLCSDLG